MTRRPHHCSDAEERFSIQLVSCTVEELLQMREVVLPGWKKEIDEELLKRKERDRCEQKAKRK